MDSFQLSVHNTFFSLLLVVWGMQQEPTTLQEWHCYLVGLLAQSSHLGVLETDGPAPLAADVDSAIPSRLVTHTLFCGAAAVWRSTDVLFT